MMPQSKTLDPLTFPLTGSALIEASAGTGKTYTLALLYLRLVLKHGGENAFTSPMLPPNILVVTFTKAATQELRDRIRARLVEAANYFRGVLLDGDVDPKLQILKQEIAMEQSLNSAARTLDVAAEWMDEAAVSTIHSWCSRVLSEHAFYSGLNFQQTLLENEKPLIIQACEDYWRECIFPLDETDLRTVLAQFKTPEALYARVGRLLDHIGVIHEVEPNISAQLHEIQHQRDSLVQAWKTTVETALPTLMANFDDAQAKKLFKATSLNKGHRAKVFDGLGTWCRSEGENLDQVFNLLSGSSYDRIALIDTSIWNDESAIPVDKDAARVLAELPKVLQSLTSPMEYLLCHSTHWIYQRVEQEKTQRGVLSQNDLLTKLDEALQSEGGDRLAEVIRKQFPVALVDEFQDTDPKQYRIFNKIYQVAEPHPNTGFFMIGDPKQAIYRFRGADIFTYLAAKYDTGDRQYTLTHNFRSAPDLVASVNHFFARAEHSHPQGAFLFKGASQNPIPFQPVQASKGQELELRVQGQRYSVQNLWDMSAEESEDKSEKKAIDRAEVTAAEIVHLLTLSQNGEATINVGKGHRPLMPNDFAVLVNNGREAKQIRQALFDLNVASVYLSDANDVFETEEAQDVLRILRAMAEPFNSFHLRIALGTGLMGLSLVELDRLNHDEVFWESYIELFRGYHHHWFQFGVMPTLYRFLTDQNVMKRYLAAANGERAITDICHIAELLQQASETIQGQQALIHYLEQCITSEKSAQESTQQRLESDADLVQVVTVHKSKGLQYPLVMLPFFDKARPVDQKDFPIEYHDENGHQKLALMADEEQVALSDAERLAEDVRKLYVAMTRAVCAQWIAMEDPKLKKGQEFPELHSAAHVLLGLKGEQIVSLAQDIPEIFSVVPCIENIDAYVDLSTQGYRPARQVEDLGLHPWWIASYSSITYGAKESGIEPVSTSSERPMDEQLYDDDATEQEAIFHDAQASFIHRLPRGSHIGTFMHGLLEWAADQRFQTQQGQKLRGFSAAYEDDQTRNDVLEARCRKRKLEKFAPELSAWLKTFLGATWLLNRLHGMHSESFRLIDLSPQDISVEMEFLFTANAVNSQQLDTLVRQSTWGGVERPAATYQQMTGMFKGFIDLVAKINGRYYVIDWKSNSLGNSERDYQEAHLKAALLEKRYDLQYVLYLVALHRHLKDRIPNYDYDQHVGGAVYFFMRGFENPETQGLIMDKPAKTLIEKLDALFRGQQPVLAMQQELDYV